MDIFAAIPVIALVAVMAAPFHLLMASPFLFAAWIISRVVPRSSPGTPRLLLILAVASIGLAPAVGAHLSVLPAYLLLPGGYITPVYAAVSFSITFVVLWAVVVIGRLAVAKLRPSRGVL